MSAWMFDHPGMCRVIDAIRHAAQNGHPTPMTLLMKPEQVARSLYAMNSKALHHQYSHDVDYCTPPTNFRYKASRADEMQMFKTIMCFTYQCSEGDVPESELYKQIEAIEHWFGPRVGYDRTKDAFGSANLKIRWSSPAAEAAYDAAKWG